MGYEFGQGVEDTIGGLFDFSAMDSLGGADGVDAFNLGNTLDCLLYTSTKLSPTDTDLETGQNWTLVHSGESTASQRTYINHKAIPIARIQSLG